MLSLSRMMGELFLGAISAIFHRKYQQAHWSSLFFHRLLFEAFRVAFLGHQLNIPNFPHLSFSFVEPCFPSRIIVARSRTDLYPPSRNHTCDSSSSFERNTNRVTRELWFFFHRRIGATSTWFKENTEENLRSNVDSMRQIFIYLRIAKFILKRSHNTFQANHL